MVRGKVRRLSTRAYSNNHHNPWYKIGPVGLEIIYICSKMLRNSSFHSLPGWVSLWMIRASKVSSNSKNFSLSCDKCTEEVLHSFSDNNSGCTIPSKDLWKKNIWFFFNGNAPGDLLLWVGVRRRASSVNIFFSRTTEPILTKFGM